MTNGYINNYAYLDYLSQDFLAHSSSTGIGAVINKYKDLNLKDDGPRDHFYTAENYKKIMKGVLFDKDPTPLWPPVITKQEEKTE